MEGGDPREIKGALTLVLKNVLSSPTLLTNVGNISPLFFPNLIYCLLSTYYVQGTWS